MHDVPATGNDGHTATASATHQERAIGVAVLVLLLVGSLAVLWPFLSALLWAIVLSFAIWPVFRTLVGWLKGRRSLAAMVIIVALAAAVLTPMIVAVANLADDAQALGAAGQSWVQRGVPAV